MDDDTAAEITKARKAVTLATTQLADHERNLGVPFEQEDWRRTVRTCGI
jgi:hypothetical protein